MSCISGYCDPCRGCASVYNDVDHPELALRHVSESEIYRQSTQRPSAWHVERDTAVAASSIDTDDDGRSDFSTTSSCYEVRPSHLL